MLGLDDLLGDPKYASTANRYEAAPYLAQRARDAIASKPGAYWRDKLTEAGLQNEMIQTYDEFVAHPHTEAVKLISWTAQPGSDKPWATPNPPGTERLASGAADAIAPALGQHTREVLSGLGYGSAEVAKLIEAKVVKAA